MKNQLWLNGELLSVDEARISPLDRGFALGDGLFETMRVRAGRILRLERHFARLRAGAQKLGIHLEWQNVELESALQQTLAANQLENAFLRLTLSRGVPHVRGLLPDKNACPSLVIQCGEFLGYQPELYQQGLRVITSAIRRNEYSPLANIKSLNYLDNILVREQAAAQGADDALMLNTAGQWVCASAANLFFVQGKTLFTAPLSAGALPGTLRAHLIEALAPACGLTIIERAISPSEITTMDESFLTNALMGIMPLVEIDQTPLGEAKPGKITRQLITVLESSCA